MFAYRFLEAMGEIPNLSPSRKLQRLSIPRFGGIVGTMNHLMNQRGENSHEPNKLRWYTRTIPDSHLFHGFTEYQVAYNSVLRYTPIVVLTRQSINTHWL